MKLVRANIPFIDRVTGKLHKVDDKPFEMTEERLAEVRAVNAHMVVVVGDVKPKKDAEPVKQENQEEPVVPEDAEPTEAEGQEEPVEPVADSEPEASDEDAQQTEPVEPTEPVVPEVDVKPEEPKQPRARKPKAE